jgi:hypothetical protein
MQVCTPAPSDSSNTNHVHLPAHPGAAGRGILRRQAGSHQHEAVAEGVSRVVPLRTDATRRRRGSSSPVASYPHERSCDGSNDP